MEMTGSIVNSSLLPSAGADVVQWLMKNLCTDSKGEVEKKPVVSVWGGKRKLINVYISPEDSIQYLPTCMALVYTRLVGQCALSVL